MTKLSAGAFAGRITNAGAIEPKIHLHHMLPRTVRLRIALIGMCLAVLAALFAWGPLEARRAQHVARQALAEAKARGLPITHADFNLSINPDELRRAQAITNAGAKWRPVRFTMQRDWMAPMGLGVAVCRWRQDADWTTEESALGLLELTLDRAVSVLLEEPPIRFAPVVNVDLLLPHLAHVKSLAGALSVRMALELRKGDTQRAWTNLLAVTAVALSYQPEPIEVSQVVRAGLVRQAFASTWEALQTNAWTDQQLRELTRRWEQAAFFDAIPLTPALSAATVRRQIEAARADLRQRPGLGSQIASVFQYAHRHPWAAVRGVWSLVRAESRQIHYLRCGSYRDDAALLAWAGEWNEEFRRTVAQPTWDAMRRLPGATNNPGMPLVPGSPLADMLNVGGILKASMRSLAGAPTAIALAAECEALRRVILTALAIERFRRATARLPQSLDEIPDARLDFINGAPLRYLLSDQGYTLYSIGLNAQDDGGAMEAPADQRTDAGSRNGKSEGPRFLRPDLVWPRAQESSGE